MKLPFGFKKRYLTRQKVFRTHIVQKEFGRLIKGLTENNNVQFHYYAIANEIKSCHLKYHTPHIDKSSTLSPLNNDIKEESIYIITTYNGLCYLVLKVMFFNFFLSSLFTVSQSQKIPALFLVTICSYNLVHTITS